jgi:hypothetical protein
MPAAPPPGFHHAHVRFREADWHELRAFAERARLPLALALRMLALRGLEVSVATETEGQP